MTTAVLDDIRRDAASCTRCDLYKGATQTVFGEGQPTARLMFVGEQPGDKEDRDGAPFVGPAGRLLDKALAEVGIPRRDAYVTNVVKHFKWRPGGRGGKVRLHQKPNAEQIAACRCWLDAELDIVQPRVVVCLGATAAQALLGRSFKVTKQRGEWIEWERPAKITATVHPSSILRADDADREIAYRGFVNDLAAVAAVLGSG